MSVAIVVIKMQEVIKKLKERVEHILKSYPHTRNSDAQLVDYVAKSFGVDPIKKASSIERCRRWFNQRGMYLPTSEEVARQRKMNIDEWKQALGYHTAPANQSSLPF